MSFLGVVAFVVALLFSIMVHEAGHFLTARKFNMKVTEFFLGFGKRIWSFRRGETEFGLKAIPAGGYCRIVGMSTREVLPEADHDRAFVRASAPKRLVVLGAGSFLHFVLGFLLLFFLYVAVGVNTVTPIIEKVAPCISSSVDGCTATDPASPATLAGIKAGDRFVSINGISVDNWSKSVEQIRASGGKELNLVIVRGDQTLNFALTPLSVLRNGKHVGVIGVINQVKLQAQNPIKAAVSAGTLGKELFTSSISSLISLPTKVPDLFRQTFMGKKRDATSLVGVVGVARVSAQTASDEKLSVRERIGTFILIISSLNIFVGIFNALPILPLDGGHMALAFADGIRNIRARRKGQPKPAPLDVERLTPVTIVVFALLVSLSLLLLAADIFNPIHLNL
ncbi:MAG: site-2 protease family protein [Actinomycetes bacterium]